MRLTKSIVAIALAATTATSAMAGGLAPTPDTTVVVPVPVEPAPQRSSWGIILPILGAALLIALATSNDDEDEGEE